MSKAIDQQAAMMAAADIEAFAVILEGLFSWAASLRIGAFSQPLPAKEYAAFTQSLIATYHEDLGDMPADLLEMAVKRTRKTWQWMNKMPLPADIRKAVTEESTRRQIEAGRLRMAKRKADERDAESKPREPLSAEAEKALTALKATLAAQEIEDRAARKSRRQTADRRAPRDMASIVARLRVLPKVSR